MKINLSWASSYSQKPLIETLTGELEEKLRTLLYDKTIEVSLTSPDSCWSVDLKICNESLKTSYINPIGLCASAELRQLPGCCGVGVICHVEVNRIATKKGVGTLINSFMLSLAEIAGFTVVVGTNLGCQPYQRKILNRLGWTQLFDIENLRTGNTVDFFLKRLK